MSNVYNWQLGRDMDYPYDAAFPNYQFAFVFNLNRCIGCQSCTMACKSTWTFSKGQENMWWNNVETKPYGGYPQHWDVKTLDLLEQANPGGQTWSSAPKDLKAPYGEFKGKTVFEAAKTNVSPEGAQKALGYLPTDEEWSAPNRFEDNPTGSQKGQKGQYFTGGEGLPQHKTWFFYLARICNHCSYPACLAACPRNAIYKRPEDGIVLIDQERCRGYRKCMEACPYKKSHYRGTTRTSEKCIGCFPRVEGRDQEGGGLPMQTRCMSACIGQIRLQGLVQMNPDGTWKEDRYHPLYYLVHVAKVAFLFIRSSVRSRTVITSRRVGCRARTCGRCSVRVWTMLWTATTIPIANCSLSSSSSARTAACVSVTKSRKGRKSSRPRFAVRSLSNTTTPSSATPRMARRSSKPPSKSRCT